MVGGVRMCILHTLSEMKGKRTQFFFFQKKITDSEKNSLHHETKKNKQTHINMDVNAWGAVDKKRAEYRESQGEKLGENYLKSEVSEIRCPFKTKVK